MLMGLLGTGMSVLEGRRREQILTSQIAQQEADRERLDNYISEGKAGNRYRRTSGPFSVLGGNK
jgi:hypothetical protein